jgi:hypothetical protein
LGPIRMAMTAKAGSTTTLLAIPSADKIRRPEP